MSCDLSFTLLSYRGAKKCFLHFTARDIPQEAQLIRLDQVAHSCHTILDGLPMSDYGRVGSGYILAVAYLDLWILFVDDFVNM